MIHLLDGIKHVCVRARACVRSCVPSSVRAWVRVCVCSRARARACVCLYEV